jgi:hypothetical protein
MRWRYAPPANPPALITGAPGRLERVRFVFGLRVETDHQQRLKRRRHVLTTRLKTLLVLNLLTT